jgi:hypothetical protein
MRRPPKTKQRDNKRAACARKGKIWRADGSETEAGNDNTSLQSQEAADTIASSFGAEFELEVEELIDGMGPALMLKRLRRTSKSSLLAVTSLIVVFQRDSLVLWVYSYFRTTIV